jgi:hypothetical protein
MANVNFPKRPPLPRDLDLRPSPDDYRPGATARASAYGREVSDSPPISEVDTPIHHQGAKVGAGANVNLRRLEEQLTREPLDEIATVVRGLIPIRISHDITVHFRAVMDAMRSGMAMRSFHAWQQAPTMAS